MIIKRDIPQVRNVTSSASPITHRKKGTCNSGSQLGQEKAQSLPFDQVLRAIQGHVHLFPGVARSPGLSGRPLIYNSSEFYSVTLFPQEKVTQKVAVRLERTNEFQPPVLLWLMHFFFPLPARGIHVTHKFPRTVHNSLSRRLVPLVSRPASLRNLSLKRCFWFTRDTDNLNTHSRHFFFGGFSQICFEPIWRPY